MALYQFLNRRLLRGARAAGGAVIDWILQLGAWNDSAAWVDTEVWEDS